VQEKGPRYLIRRIRKDKKTAGKKGKLRIMLMGLLILSAPLSIKYGMRLWVRLRPANDSEALSEAT
jgi:hypothetical protein